jgi:hypothetical protein
MEELLIFVFPVVFGVGFWLIIRRKPDGNPPEGGPPGSD